MPGNTNLRAAQRLARDEFYTQLTDIERELQHYWAQLRGKTVLCNCDDPGTSQFFVYFRDHFHELGLKWLLASCVSRPELGQKAVYARFDGEKLSIRPLQGTGDFRSAECLEILFQADVVVTNPPFSLFREFVPLLENHGKKFLVVGSQNAITYQEIFPLIQKNRLWLGFGFPSAAAHFVNRCYTDYAASTDHREGMIRVSGVQWFTNLDVEKRREFLPLVCRYSPRKFPRYENYDAIEVAHTAEIPRDWPGVMGVPITFLTKYNPEQFTILGLAASAKYRPELVGIPFKGTGNAKPILNGKITYARIFIQRSIPQKNPGE
jgi:hypothetical protein